MQLPSRAIRSRMSALRRGSAQLDGNPSDRQALAARRYGIVRDAQVQFDARREPSIDSLIVDYMGAAVPVAPQAQVAVAAPGDTVIRPRDTPTALQPAELPPSTAQD